MIPVNDEVFNSLCWEAVDGLELDGVISGLTVIGAEPIDYPLTDGITLYAKDSTGKLLVFDIGVDPCSEEPSFYVRKATIKEEATA